MASKTIESYRNGAEISKGDADCKKKSKKKVEHTFKKIKQVVSYATEVTAFVEKGKLKKITGVKTKELLIWLSVVEVYMEEVSKEKVTFKTGTGLSDSFDASAFELFE
ncbi:hypothetical protein LUZ63_001420 [Rhynchospora breviuscula]|uniref:Uncharacterized protein n=1 Tax=Rhynchospora breviuscula TaxID=2022672 RepID=A0A9Q0CWX9_9POAL|nr:hypothetical protein LUZ63_001420 [Rhynchospora breviuscula]